MQKENISREERNKKIIELRKAGKSYPEIGKETGLSNSSIAAVLAKAGLLVRRPYGKRQKPVLISPISLDSQKFKAIVFQGSVTDVLEAIKGIE